MARQNRIFVIIFIIIFIIFFSVIKQPTKDILESTDSTNVVKISASFYPLAEFARQTGGEKVSVITITPKGTEPHDFEPSPKDIVNISNSDIFIFNGSKFDPWAEKIAPILKEKGVLVINVTDRLQSNTDDPHTWLDPILAKKTVEIIRNELKNIDPSNIDIYNYNTEIYGRKLTALDKRYTDSLQNCETRHAIASHGAFGYVADRYNINIISISGISPDKEPSARELGNIVKFAREKEIKYIFFETLTSSKLSETIAKEIGAKILALNPIEMLTEREETSGKNYISIMNNNLNSLQTALRCKK